MNLNGPWQFQLDLSDSGREEGLHQHDSLSGSITVPFCPESALSGVGHTGFIRAVWYKRRFSLPADWAGNRVLLHFGAVDYEAEVWLNGHSVGSHRGGYASFHFDITPWLNEGENLLTLCARDDIRLRKQPSGKQSHKRHSYECSYTRTTGIWQTVWLEPVAEDRVDSFQLYPDPDNACLHLQLSLKGVARGRRLTASATLEGEPVGEVTASADCDSLRLSLPLSTVKLWGPGQPTLYDLRLTLSGEEGQALDQVDSYFGLRTLRVQGNKLTLNGQPLFQRLVLDQGFYPEGVYTAPSDADLRRDIELAMALGFHGARLHQKVFEQRFLYWADRLGYLVWGEYADTGLDLSSDSVLYWMLPEWQEVIARDFNSPALIAWCPLNEVRNGPSGARLRPDLIQTIWEFTKRQDPTRPAIDASGFIHTRTDLYDVHEYEQDPTRFASFFAPMAEGGSAFDTHPDAQRYAGQPYLVGEYGGTWWSPEHDPDNQMSYGSKPKSEEDFLQRFEALTVPLLDNPAISGLCYTQLYDVEQEVNGLCTYDRRPKFDPERIRVVLARKAAIERE